MALTYLDYLHLRCLWRLGVIDKTHPQCHAMYHKRAVFLPTGRGHHSVTATDGLPPHFMAIARLTLVVAAQTPPEVQGSIMTMPDHLYQVALEAYHPRVEATPVAKSAS